MDRTGYPVEIAIGLLVMAAFLYMYRSLPANAPAVAPGTTSSSDRSIRL
jgi:hypothetical protein